MTAPPEDLVRANLDWLGYGHPDSKFWFFEYEESMYDPGIYGNSETLTEVLEHRSQYGEFIDFKEAWEERSGTSLSRFRGHSYTWNYEAAFLLGARGRTTIRNEETHQFVFEDAKLGRVDGNNFSCEARPLPKSDVTGTGPYSHVWTSVQEYHRDVRTIREDQLNRLLVGNDIVEWIIVSGKNNLMLPLFQSMFDLEEITRLQADNDKIPYIHYRMDVSPHQRVNMVHAPFFGQGRTAYDNAVNAGYQFVFQQ